MYASTVCTVSSAVEQIRIQINIKTLNEYLTANHHVMRTVLHQLEVTALSPEPNEYRRPQLKPIMMRKAH